MSLVPERTTSVLKCKASLVHLVLLDNTTGHEVNAARRVALYFQSTRLECPLLSDEDIEVVVRSVDARVPFRSQGSAEDDEVFGDAGVDDVHGAHGASGIVKHPFFVGVEVYLVVRVCFGEIGHNVLDHARSVIWRSVDCCDLKLVEEVWIKNVPAIL